jgi:hypothetical protein
MVDTLAQHVKGEYYTNGVILVVFSSGVLSLFQLL